MNPQVFTTQSRNYDCCSTTAAVHAQEGPQRQRSIRPARSPLPPRCAGSLTRRRPVWLLSSEDFASSTRSACTESGTFRALPSRRTSGAASEGPVGLQRSRPEPGSFWAPGSRQIAQDTPPVPFPPKSAEGGLKGRRAGFSFGRMAPHVSQVKLASSASHSALIE